MQDLIVIESTNTRARITLAAVIIVTLVCGLLMIKWQLGNMFATLTPVGDPNAAQIAALAWGWSPNDPSAGWLAATTKNDLGMFEQTVRLAPFDYRWRQELGRALEQDEQPDRAEAEFKRAIELAPNFAFPHWRLANFYLRQDRVDEALAELKKAAENNQTYREQSFSLVWDYFGKDTAIVESIAGDKPESRARLAYFFAGRGHADDAIRIWNTLDDETKAANPELAKGMALGLYDQRKFRAALEFSKQAGFDPNADPETITDGSFERGLGESGDSRFNWRVVRNDPKMDIAIDQKVKREGTRSLRVSFKNYVKPELYNISQTVVTEPNTAYRLKFWVRTENLKSAGTPLIEIINANDDKLLARSLSYPTGSNDWQELTVDFTTPVDCVGVTVRTARSYCGDACPITGIFWYDTFELGRQ
jgi:tetratricopeptide (TPR) repeat protein